MRSVMFGDYSTAEDNLILNSKTISDPTPKYVRVSVDGRDGDINLSRALTGEMKFNNREASFTFLVTEGTHSEREEVIRRIANEIHGRELQIIEPDDVNHYLFGECSVTDTYNDKAYGSITITADCEPYRYAIDEISRIVTLSSAPTEIALVNTGRKKLIPEITVSDSVNMEFGSTSVSLSRGTYKLTSLVLAPGNTIVSLSGSGGVTFKYREAVL